MKINYFCISTLALFTSLKQTLLLLNEDMHLSLGIELK